MAKKKKLAEGASSIPTSHRFLTFERRRSLWGWAFISPWLIGVILFFIVPMIQAGIYTFSKITVSASGFNYKFIGLKNYIWAFTESQGDKLFKEQLVTAIGNMLWQVPIIVFFSMFVAMLIKEKFVGRTLARSIFFLPVIIASGVVISILKESVLMSTGAASDQPAYMFQAPSFVELFTALGVPTKVTDIVQNVISQLFDLTWKSGVQILLLLAAINNIPSSSYEVADMEGATGWEKFWKITFPMVSPTLLVTLVYTIIDSFTDYSNPVMRMVSDYTGKGNYDYGTTLAFIYFLCVLLIIGLVNLIISRFVFYYNE